MGLGKMGAKKVRNSCINSNTNVRTLIQNTFIGLIWFANSMQFSLSPRGSFFSDSLAYGAGDIRNWEQLSFLGNSLRNWPIVLLNVALGDRVLQTFAQFAVSAFVWSYLIWNIQRYISGRTYYVVSAMITILAISPHVISWNSVLLAESYATSGLVLALIFGFRYSVTKSKIDRSLFAGAILFWATLQSRHFLALLVLALVSLPFLSRSIFKSLRSMGIGTIIALSLTVSYIGFININQQTNDFNPGISYRAFSNIYTFAAHSQSTAIKSSLANEPGFECVELLKNTDVIVIAEKLVKNCPIALKWLEENYSFWYAKFLAQHPTYTLKLLVEGIASSNNPPEFYAGTVSITPTILNSIYFGSRNYSFGSFENVSDKMVLVENDKQQFVVITKGNTVSYNAIKANAPIFLWFYLGILLLLRNLYKSAHVFQKTKVKELNPLMWLVCLSLLGFAINLLVCPAEYFKLTIQFATLLFLGTILLAATEVNSRAESHEGIEN
jgi:hypothetical protein